MQIGERVWLHVRQGPPRECKVSVCGHPEVGLWIDGDDDWYWHRIDNVTPIGGRRPAHLDQTPEQREAMAFDPCI